VSTCWTHLVAASLVPDELETRDALLGADHAHVLRVLAVRHPEAVGVAPGQTLLSSGAVNVVQPDLACSGGEKTTRLEAQILWFRTYV